MIGFVILVVASVNYINLTTAKALRRAREVGIRKVVGASRAQLVRQVILDALLINVVGFLFGLTLLQLCSPLIGIWAGREYSVFDWTNTELAICLGTIAGNTILSGTVPAFFLTRIEPVRALKGLTLRSSGAGYLRQGLVVFQFVVSVGLIVFTYALFSQVQHMRSKEKGFDVGQRIILESIGTEDFDFSRFRAFKHRIEGHPKILSTTGAFSLPGLFKPGWSFVSRPEFPGERLGISTNVVDFDYVKTLGITLTAGREFTEDRMTEEKVVMINEAAVKELGYADAMEAVDKVILFHRYGFGDQPLKIIGVVKDYHSLSPGIRVRAEIFRFANTAWPFDRYSYFIAHIAPGQLRETIDFIEQQWKHEFPLAPFQYTFQDQAFQNVFESDEKMQSLAGLSTVVAVLIACMGLGGLVAFSVNQRVKEIGIRKTLGASVGRILYLLSGFYVRLILISVVLALPLAWYAVQEYLETYEYRIELSVWMFLLPCALLLTIAVSVMSYQTIKAARSNPVEALKYE